jgi:hypothetical protein
MNAPFGIDASKLRNRSWVAGEVGNKKRSDVPSFMCRSISARVHQGVRQSRRVRKAQFVATRHLGTKAFQ